jgi:transcriptional regulator with XRE-family HTH domain
MKDSRSADALPLPVRRALVKLGGDISLARRLRGLSVALVAERAMVGRNTITRLEAGDSGVSIGIYATVLFIIGMADRLADLADPASDPVGLAQAERAAPKRPGRRRAAAEGA